MKKTKITVIGGNIAQEPSDALITAINSWKDWRGGIDKVIMGVAGRHFHNQASEVSLSHGNTVIASGEGSNNRGKFQNVVFVVDDLKNPLRNIVRAGLDAAAKAGFKKVTLPTIRMGAALGRFEKSTQEAVIEMAVGIQEYLANFPDAIEEIVFVVYEDERLEKLLAAVLDEYVDILSK